MFDTEQTTSDESLDTREAVSLSAERALARPKQPGQIHAKPLAAADTPRDALQLYLSWIRDIPVLQQPQVDALSAEIDDCERRFREAMYAVPATSLAVVDRWKERKEAGRTTAMLAHGYRNDVKRNWTKHLDRHVGAIEARLSRIRGASNAEAATGRALRVTATQQAELAKHLREAEILLEVLIEIHDEHAGVVADWGSSRNRRRASAMGLGQARWRGSLAVATAALRERTSACSEFATHNLRLVVNVAKRFRGLGLSYMDLIQEGNKGLLRAVEKYDHTKGFTFATYAVWWIDQAVIRGVQNHSRTVRVPSHVHQERRRIRQVEERMRGELERAPTERELAAACELEVEELERIQSSHRVIRSLDEPVGEKGKNSVSDTLVAEPGPEPCAEEDQRRIRKILSRGLRTLEERERTIVQWRYGLDGEPPQTLRAIGKRLGISRERVRQIEVKALETLRGRSDVGALESHFESPLAAA